MTRVIFINLLLIIAPFLLYGLYVLFEKNPKTAAEFWPLIPLKKLLAIGFALMIVFYITQIKFKGDQEGIYHPPVVRDGKVIPGYIEPRDKKNENQKQSDPSP